MKMAHQFEHPIPFFKRVFISEFFAESFTMEHLELMKRDVCPWCKCAKELSNEGYESVIEGTAEDVLNVDYLDLTVASGASGTASAGVLRFLSTRRCHLVCPANRGFAG